MRTRKRWTLAFLLSGGWSLMKTREGPSAEGT